MMMTELDKLYIQFLSRGFIMLKLQFAFEEGDKGTGPLCLTGLPMLRCAHVS
jgi:hypothetical protein